MSEPWPLRTSSEFRTNLLFSFHRPVESDDWSAKAWWRLNPEGSEHSHHHCAQYPPVCVCVRSVDGYQGVCMVSIPCVLFESLCIFTQHVSAHTGLGLPYVNTHPPRLFCCLWRCRHGAFGLQINGTGLHQSEFCAHRKSVDNGDRSFTMLPWPNWISGRAVSICPHSQSY